MLRSSRPRILAGSALTILVLLSGALAGCRGGDDDGASAELAARWLRLGEEPGTNVAVYEAALPPMLSDLLNPGADAETPEEDRVSLPVHPQGELLGSYSMRRPDGSHLLWLFYDVPEAEVGPVTVGLSQQLDESPWQVVGEQGNSGYTVVQFQSTRGDDVSGTVIVEPLPATDEFEVVVDRGGEEVRLQVARAASAPRLEAEFEDDLTVDSTFPGLAREAGLQEGDRVVSVAGTDVSTPAELDGALAALGDGVGPLSLTYLLQIAPARALEGGAYVPRSGLSLPADFPLRDGLQDLVVNEYQSFIDPAGNFFAASLLAIGSTSTVAGQMRDVLTADNWEIVADQPVGFATSLLFTNEDGTLQGSMEIDLFPEDESFTQVIVRIQTASPGG